MESNHFIHDYKARMCTDCKALGLVLRTPVREETATVCLSLLLLALLGQENTVDVGEQTYMLAHTFMRARAHTHGLDQQDSLPTERSELRERVTASRR